MGTMPRAPVRPADALFAPVQQRVLGLLFTQPERRFRTGEIIELAAGGTGATHRFLARLEAAGIVVVTRSGNQKLYQANSRSPIFQEIKGLIQKTTGLVGPIRDALAQLQGVQAAFVFGSVAKGIETATSDIDVMVISDSVTHADLYEALHPLESMLGRRIQPTVTTPVAWRAALKDPRSFESRVCSGPRLDVLGSPDDVS
jgi:predicted nucleotidyltransferase